MSSRFPYSLPARFGLLSFRAHHASHQTFSGGRARAFHLAIICSLASETIQTAAVEECLLRCTHVAFLPLPCFKNRFLERSPIGKTELPRMRPHRIHGVQVIGCILGTLTSREKYNPRYRRGHIAAEAADCGVRN